MGTEGEKREKSSYTAGGVWTNRAPRKYESAVAEIG